MVEKIALKTSPRIFELAEIFGKVTFDPYNFRITRLSARKTEQMKIFRGQKYGYIYSLHTKIRLTMLCLSYLNYVQSLGAPAL